ncbi:GMC oxidoreductase [Trametes elegans]|nr:GMC oxidoreductase [Trametes elegans]
MTANITADVFASTEFDYLVVGGGNAGLVVATRLTEDPSIRVGVVEAGSWNPNDNIINVPALSGTVIANPQYDWAFMSAPQKDANARQVLQPRGKVLGGSSAVSNGSVLMHNSASAREYDGDFCPGIEALGNPGWNWNEFLKYFRKSETTVPPPADIAAEHRIPCEVNAQYHGDSGPIVNAYPTWTNALRPVFLETLGKLGVPQNAHPDDGDNLGAFISNVAIDPTTAVRSYSANAYYGPNASRPNLVVLTNSQVTKITVREGTTPLQATGLEFLSGDKTFTVKARKEVILCAGAAKTPQILELSGIGNKDILSKYGIETRVDLPGDHVSVFTVHEIDPQYETLDSSKDPEEVARQQELYKSQRGYLSSAHLSFMGMVPAKAFFSDEQSQKWKDEALARAKDAPQGLRKQLELQIRWFSDPQSVEAELLPLPYLLQLSGIEPEPGAHFSSMACALMHPLSRGHVHIASADPTAPPDFDPKYFSNPLDLELLVNFLKFALKLYETSPLSDAVRQQAFPRPDRCTSDEALIEYVRENCNCFWHPIASASMLPQEDGGVVDPQLKVYGTANIRVVRSSHVVRVGSHSDPSW